MSTPKVIRTARAPAILMETTPELIEKSIPADSGHCVYADAVKAACPTASRISVDLQTIRFTDLKKGFRYTYLTPRTVQVDLVNFDQGVKPEPKKVRLHGGQVTLAHPRKASGEIKMGVSSKARLAHRDDAAGRVPDRVGGMTPPLAAFAHAGGKRRVFGLRGLGRPTKETP